MIGAKQLIPLACNLNPISFKYGEYLIKEGEVPPGLIIIVQGTCRVTSSVVTDHKYLDTKDKYKPKWTNRPQKTGYESVFCKEIKQDN